MPDAGLPELAALTNHEMISAARASDLGVAARRTGKLIEALVWFRRALELQPMDRRARVELAGTLRGQGRTAEAEGVYRALLADEPSSWQALVGLGICARMRQDLATSAEHLAAALAMAPREREVRLEYAGTLRGQGRTAEAEGVYRALLADEPSSWQALVGLGICARMRQDLATSAEHLAAALAMAPREREVRLEYAGTLRGQGRTAEAEGVYRALLADEPSSWQALVGLGICARMRQDLATSAEHLAAALAMAPREREVRLEYAGTLRGQGRTAEAEGVYRALLADEPSSWQALVGLGICTRMRQDLATSAEHLAAALAMAPREREVRLEYAGTLRGQGRTAEAEGVYRALLADEPSSWQALVGLGICARMRQDLATSAEHLAAALAMAPREREVRLEYAGTLRGQGRTAEAEGVYRALLADEPSSWQALVGLGICTRMRQDLATSAEHLAAALAMAPREREVRLEYAGTLRGQGRTAEAEGVYRALLADEPSSWQALVGLGICARMRHDRAAALAYITEATEAAPEVEGTWVELAHELREAGRFDQARTILRSLIDRALAGPATWLGLGIVERWADQRPAALDAFREGHAQYPEWHQFLIEMAIEERALGRFAEAESWLLRAVRIPAGACAALIQMGEMARMRQQLEQALDLFRRASELPTPSIGVHPAMAQTLADLGRQDEAFGILDAAEQRIGPRPELAQKRAFLLRRAGFRQEARAVAREAAAEFPMHMPVWFEWFENERICADFVGIARCLDAAPAGHLHERAQVHLARGLVAEQRWDLEAATDEFRKALALNPSLSGLHEQLARISLLRFDIPAAREHLESMKRLREPTQRALGMSPHLTHTHLGNFFDEFVIDSVALGALVEVQSSAPAARIERLLTLVRAAPDHTATAIALLVALRRAGRFAFDRPETVSPAIPKTIVQYWDEEAPPGDIVALMQSWRECNPSHRYVRFNHAAAQDFLRRRCVPEVLRAYLIAREPAMKADLFRLAYLFAEGGYYADADDRCLRPLDEALSQRASFVAYQEHFGTLGNNFLAAAPLHPVMGLALDLAVEAVNRGDEDMLWLSTGPGLLTRAFARTLAMSGLRPAAWAEWTCILANHELERVVAPHCDLSYKNSKQHWLRAKFGQAKSAGCAMPKKA